MRKSIIPPKGSIPLNVRGKGNTGLGFSINIGGLGSMKRSHRGQESKKFEARSVPKKAKVEKKIDSEDMKKWAVNELSHLFELREYGANVLEQVNRILEFIPKIFWDEIIKKAEGKGSALNATILALSNILIKLGMTTNHSAIVKLVTERRRNTEMRT